MGRQASYTMSALSVVGIDRLQGSCYFNGKQAQEDLLKTWAIDASICALS